MRPRVLVAALLCGVSLCSFAQQAPRAVPVEDDEAPVPKAIPVAPSPRAQVVEEAPANKPKGPDEDLYDYALMVYDRQEYGLATQSFAQYLRTYPSGRHVAGALFRIGESYMKLNKMAEAERYYEEVVNRYPDSDGAPSAAYRLGAVRFNNRTFGESAQYFAFSESKSPLPEVRLAAAFNKARAYQMMGETKRQLAALASVVAVKTNNPYRESALLTLGTALLGQDRKNEALPLFQDLLKESKDNVVISEAAVKAGALLAETGKPEEAIPLFEKALDLKETSEVNRGIALVGVVQALFLKGDFDGVIDNFNRNAAVLPAGETRPKMLLMVGNAYRMKKSYARAVEVYLMIEESEKFSDIAFEAGYWKLYCFYLLNDKDLGDFATAFILRYNNSHPTHEFMNLARLIRADFFFNKPDFAKAAESFVDVNIDKLAEKLRPGTLFNQGWAQAEAGRAQDAVASFSRFLAEHPQHEYAPKALARRGLAYKDARDLPKAMADFKRVTSDYPTSDAAEMAWLQMGLVAMEQRDSKATIQAFETLVAKFPNSAAAAQAYYGIGRGYFDQKLWDKAAPALRRSIEIDKEGFLEKSSQMLILCFYAKQDAMELAKTIDTYRSSNEKANVSPNVLTWLGLKFFDLKDYKRSAKYLTQSATPDTPENTDPRVWNYLAMALLETKSFEESLKASNHFLAVTPESAAKARGLLTKGRALLGMQKYAEADKVVQEGLQFVKDGKPQALLLILEGDIFYANGLQLQKDGQEAAAQTKFQAAAAKYVVPSQFFDDNEVTPEALVKAAIALDASGDKAKAEQMRSQLKQEYPGYQQPASASN